MSGTYWALGEIDLATAPSFDADLRDTIDRGDEAMVSVDCAGVTFMGTAAYRVLVAATDYAARRGRTLVIRNLSSSCARLVHLCDAHGDLHVEQFGRLGRTPSLSTVPTPAG